MGERCSAAAGAVRMAGAGRLDLNGWAGPVTVRQARHPAGLVTRYEAIAVQVLNRVAFRLSRCLYVYSWSQDSRALGRGIGCLRPVHSYECYEFSYELATLQPVDI